MKSRLKSQFRYRRIKQIRPAVQAEINFGDAPKLEKWLFWQTYDFDATIRRLRIFFFWRITTTNIIKGEALTQSENILELWGCEFLSRLHDGSCLQIELRLDQAARTRLRRAAGVLEYVFSFGPRSTGKGLDQRDPPRVGVCCWFDRWGFSIRGGTSALRVRLRLRYSGVT